MFTGIIEETGRVICRSGSWGIKVSPKLSRMRIGASLAVNGVCLTVRKRSKTCLFFDLLKETLERTALGILGDGDVVNLERPLKASDRIDGHFVQGHVDGVGRVVAMHRRGREASLKIAGPPAIRPFLVQKGSIAVDGVSLTLGRIEGGCFWLHLVPHTLQMTSLGRLKPGDRVNLEADILLKWLDARISV